MTSALMSRQVKNAVFLVYTETRKFQESQFLWPKTVCVKRKGQNIRKEKNMFWKVILYTWRVMSKDEHKCKPSLTLWWELSKSRHVFRLECFEHTLSERPSEHPVWVAALGVSISSQELAADHVAAAEQLQQLSTLNNSALLMSHRCVCACMCFFLSFCEVLTSSTGWIILSSLRHDGTRIALTQTQVNTPAFQWYSPWVAMKWLDRW